MDVETYLADRGVTSPRIVDALVADGWSADGSWLVIPWRGRDGERIYESRRSLNGSGPKYKNFPSRRIDGRPSINQERGFNSQIADRLDLTVECIRRHYLGEVSPMAEVLIRYGDFFALFEDFNGYTDFFLLQDLVSDDSLGVKFFMPFAAFATSPLPPAVEVYQDYRQNAIRFVEARNRRMAEYVVRL